MYYSSANKKPETEYEYRKRNNANFGFYARTGVAYSNKYTAKEKKTLLNKYYKKG